MALRSLQLRLVGAALPLLAASLVGCGVNRRPSEATDAAPSVSASQAPRAYRVLGPFMPTSLTMVTAQTGWALTRSGVYRTLDGGHHWLNVTPKGYQGISGAGMLDARGAYPGAQFPSRREAVVAVPEAPGASTVVVWTTQNGGTSWSRVDLRNSGAPVLALSMPDTRYGWLETLVGGAAGSEAVNIYRTEDAGKTWIRVGGAGLNRAGAGTLPFGGDKLGLAFGSLSNGVAVGEEAAPAAWVYYTRNGGRTWLPATVPHTGKAGSLIITAIPQFFGPDDALMAASLIPGPGGATDTVVYRSTDGGARWTPGQALPGRATAVDFVSPTTGWVLDGRLYHTVNGGITWSAMTGNVRAGGSLDFVNATLGWRFPAVGEPAGLQITQNGGRSWSPWIPHLVAPTIP